MQSPRTDLTHGALERIAAELIDLATSGDLGIREGTVMTVGAPPYRRLDCDGRALAYIRTRPRRRAVRVDVSGLWIATEPPHFGIRGAGGSVTLLLQRRADLVEATTYIEALVVRTRKAHEQEHRRRRATGHIAVPAPVDDAHL
ncbi:MAG: hypothetical protein IPK13_21110 [Deltaproteobacteria bacterium]|nr:hypothetical protein [Deltaproteobacteria bacterium]